MDYLERWVDFKVIQGEIFLTYQILFSIFHWSIENDTEFSIQVNKYFLSAYPEYSSFLFWYVDCNWFWFEWIFRSISDWPFIWFLVHYSEYFIALSAETNEYIHVTEKNFLEEYHWLRSQLYVEKLINI